MYLYGKSLAMDLLALGKKKFSLFSMKVFYTIKHIFFKNIMQSGCTKEWASLYNSMQTAWLSLIALLVFSIAPHWQGIQPVFGRSLLQVKCVSVILTFKSVDDYYKWKSQEIFFGPVCRWWHCDSYIFFLNSMPTFEFLASWDIHLTMTEEKHISSYSVCIET